MNLNNKYILVLTCILSLNANALNLDLNIDLNKNSNKKNNNEIYEKSLNGIISKDLKTQTNDDINYFNSVVDPILQDSFCQYNELYQSENKNLVNWLNYINLTNKDCRKNIYKKNAYISYNISHIVKNIEYYKKEHINLGLCRYYDFINKKQWFSQSIDYLSEKKEQKEIINSINKFKIKSEKNLNTNDLDQFCAFREQDTYNQLKNFRLYKDVLIK